MALVKAKFITGSGSDKKEIPVHFNPSEYSINLREVSSADAGSGQNAQTSPTVTNVGKSFVETLALTLYYDTFTSYAVSLTDSVKVEKADVRAYTEEVVALAKPDNNKKQIVSFVWGSLNFTGYIDSVSQKFTMFMDDGKPVRACLTINMTSCPDTSSVNGTLKKGSRYNVDFSSDGWKLAAAAVVKMGKLREIFD